MSGQKPEVDRPGVASASDPGATGIDWDEVEALFDRMVELPETRRESSLAKADVDAAVAREVGELLDAFARSDGFLEDEAAPEEATRILARLDSELAGRQIGPYRLLEELGRGGMGTVYLARRADGQFEQRVAIKLIRWGPERERLTAGFLRERQILSDLSHSNIARLLDGGVTGDGEPYLVMEFIEGRRIDRYCDEARLSIEQRISLFREVCEAVQHAHRQLVVHRDLKPGNILVTDRGTPKLLDFGTAKLIEPLSSAGLTAPPTAAAPLFTPEYASPEQVRGEPITTASDVYSMGVLLYELLTGQRPYDIDRSRPQELLEKVCEEEPLRPSARVRQAPARRASLASAGQRDSEALARALEGDLDTILLKALHKNPQRRYGSIDQLSEDLQRHLDAQPVRARPDTVGYRLGKFLRRRRGSVAAAALVVASLVGGIIATAWQARLANQARARAEQQAETAERIAEFLTEVFSVSDPQSGRGSTIDARQLLDEGARKITEGLDEEPAVRAALMDAMGTAYYRLGLYDSADPLLRSALALRRELPDADADIADSLEHLGEMLGYTGEFEKAEPLFRESYDLRVELWGEDHVAVARSLRFLADIDLTLSRYETSRQLYFRALDIQTRLLGEQHLDVAETKGMIANLLRITGPFDEAEQLLREALETRRQLDAYDQPLTAGMLGGLALLLSYQGRYDEALEVHGEAYELQLRWYGEDHFDTVRMINDKALLDQFRGEHRLAAEGFRRAVAGFRRVFGDRHHYVAIALSNQAGATLQLGDLGAAEQLSQEALELHIALLGEDHVETAGAFSTAAHVAAAQERLDDAEALHRRVLAIYRQQLGDDIPGIASVHYYLGEIEARRGNWAEAEILLRDTLDRYVATPNMERWLPATARLLATVLIELDRQPEAEHVLLEHCLPNRDAVGVDPKEPPACEQLLVELYDSQGRSAEADRLRSQG